MEKTKFLVSDAIKSPAPKWATYSFRVIFLLTTVVSFWIASTTLVDEGNKTEWVLALKTIDMFVWGITRLLGVVEVDDVEK